MFKQPTRWFVPTGAWLCTRFSLVIPPFAYYTVLFFPATQLDKYHGYRTIVTIGYDWFHQLPPTATGFAMAFVNEPWPSAPLQEIQLTQGQAPQGVRHSPSRGTTWRPLHYASEVLLTDAKAILALGRSVVYRTSGPTTRLLEPTKEKYYQPILVH